VEHVEQLPARKMGQPQAPAYTSRETIEGCDDPPCTCETTASHAEHGCAADTEVLPPPQAKFYCLKLVTRSYEVANSGRYWRVDVIGSAGSYSGLALHSVLSDFACFPGSTKLAAIASPPEMLRLATGERSVIAFRIGYVSGNHPP